MVGIPLKYYWAFLAIVWVSTPLFAQQKESADTSYKHMSLLYDVGMYPKKEPLGLKQVSIGGFYRFFATNMTMDSAYQLTPNANDTTLPRTLFIGDDSQLPNLMINVAGRPSNKVSWGFDLFMFQFLDGQIGQAYSQQVADSSRPSIWNPLGGVRLGGNLGLNLGLNLYANIKTRYANLAIKTGGIHWHQMTDFTFGNFTGYNRFMLFEREPWDPVSKNIDGRYDQFYNYGAVSQNTRWGKRAFQGLIIDATQLPHDIIVSVLYGKTELNGGFDLTPNLSYGGMIRKGFNNGQHVGFNTMNSTSYLDSLITQEYGYNILTADFLIKHKGFELYSELGTGRYFSPGNNDDWGGAYNVKLKATEKVIPIPLELHYYYISEKVYNNNSAFLNTSVAEVTNNDIPAGQIGSSAVLQPFASTMTAIGQMANNRTGLFLNSQFNYKKFNFNLGFGFSQELTNTQNSLTYSHPVNQLTRSRLWRWNFPSGVGPYGRESVIYRSTYETVNLLEAVTNTDGFKKYFGNIEGLVKYKTNIAGRPLYLFYLATFASAQDYWTPFTSFDEDTFLRQYAHQLEAYQNINSWLNVVGYLGHETTLGNYSTDLDVSSNAPREQEGVGYGLGLDVSLGKQAQLSFRHRWFEYEDKNFAADRFKGQESLIEIKAFF